MTTKLDRDYRATGRRSDLRISPRLGEPGLCLAASGTQNGSHSEPFSKGYEDRLEQDFEAELNDARLEGASNPTGICCAVRNVGRG